MTTPGSGKTLAGVPRGILLVAFGATALVSAVHCGPRASDTAATSTARSTDTGAANTPTMSTGTGATSDTGAPAGGPTSKEACVEIWKQGMDQVAQAGRDAEAPCKVDAECVGASNVVCGHGGCGVAISKAKEGDYKANVAKIETNVCAAFNASPICSAAPIPTPSCPAMKPTCKAGRCTSP